MSEPSDPPSADILVVDDDPKNLDLLSSKLAGHGHKFRVATSGQGAIMAVRSSRPDLIMLNVRMPDLDGYEVCRRLKDDPETRSVPVIFISALDEALDKVRAFEIGGADYVSKPFQFEEVLARIEHQLEIARLQESLQKRNEELATKNELLTKISIELEVANAELTRLSTTDALTGIPNRRQFHDRIEVEWRRAERDRRELSLLMIDVDNFKQFNDTYGHQLGDDCLRDVAQAIQRELRTGGDFVARYGGEEFIVLLPGTSMETAVVTGERLCSIVRELEIPHGTSTVADIVTISVGTASILPDVSSDWSLLVRSADEALYRAKTNGRNRVAS